MTRQEFPGSVKKAAMERSQGRCEAVGVRYNYEPGERCTRPVGPGNVNYEHYPRGAHDPSPETRSLSNCTAICPQCNAWAAQKHDTPFEAKLKRSLRKRGLGSNAPKVKKPIPQPANFKWPSKKFETRKK